MLRTILGGLIGYVGYLVSNFIFVSFFPEYIDTTFQTFFNIIALIVFFISFSIIIYILQKKISLIQSKSDDIQRMQNEGMSIEDIIRHINEEHDKISIEPELKTIKFDPINGVIGYYQGVPIYERIKLSTGKILKFDGVSEFGNALMMRENVFVVKPGVMYVEEK